ncbi:hypothetical protein AAFF_G00104130 [Aldrovandia affinis]|uniref:Uncharacterized protein n=1 Tax=Aldrovandia affinis TaxID=143900 RepID=A0AAD7R1D3_9TELE|nr:hypothetical protein AAFF_G00104130 [Aldrovandia affinis]
MDPVCGARGDPRVRAAILSRKAGSQRCAQGPCRVRGDPSRWRVADLTPARAGPCGARRRPQAEGGDSAGGDLKRKARKDLPVSKAATLAWWYKASCSRKRDRCARSSFKSANPAGARDWQRKARSGPRWWRAAAICREGGGPHGEAKQISVGASAMDLPWWRRVATSSA